jgi:hypothetical protein
MADPIKNNILTGTATAAAHTVDGTATGVVNGAVVGGVLAGAMAWIPGFLKSQSVRAAAEAKAHANGLSAEAIKLAGEAALSGGLNRGNGRMFLLTPILALVGGIAGAAVGGAVGSIKGLAGSIDKIQSQNAAHAMRQEDLTNQAMAQAMAMQDKRLESMARDAYQQGTIDATQQFMAMAQQAHGAAAEAPAAGRFTAMAPPPGAITPEGVRSAQEEAAQAPRQL